MSSPLRGVYAPVLTPFDQDMAPDVDRFIAHCRWVVDSGAGLAVFGTNSEAASLSVDERIGLTDALLAAGIPAARLMPGTGACALTDAVTLTRHAVASGAPGVLMLPPFFFKNVSDDGVFAYYAEIIERVGSDKLGIYLYHIPQFTQVPITLSLIERLLKRYPDTVRGAKDSSGDWNNSKAMIEGYASEGFAVFPASESLLSKSLAIGGAGCISATINMNPGGIRALFDGWNTPQGEALQAEADAVRLIFQAAPMIPAMKRVVAEFAQDPGWSSVRPPLVALDEAAAAVVLAALRGVEFDMPAYPRTSRG
ncbi:dihydrodipicolinate synthase family protein [Variovorax sp. PAMC 28711]|uniref:dihydrodipicolinate synthase family protein n=1 Tax=Variovorax sp. PAMC 28711 TaxID=1795631 RepID=UPI00078BCFA3|nr:dihydrodipicolinate synthase family protein [Variovorax sp. PAMC 28711]AMM25934.1 dihydrodipicolinate synthase family protein [Variovorax sp. PAMC 28711]